MNNGERLGCETPEKYKSKRIRDRFTAEMLEEYTLHLGIRLFDADFYGPRGVLLRDLDPLPRRFEEFSLVEARARHGLD